MFRQNFLHMNLLLLACSQKKVNTKDALPAIELYDGPAYRIVRKMEREGKIPSYLDIYIVSGKYGLIPSWQKINTYDQRLTYDIVVKTGAHAKLKELLSLPHQQVLVNMGKEYLSYFEDILGGAILVKGRIGEKNSQMKKWLLQL